MSNTFLIIKDPAKPSYRLNLAADIETVLVQAGHVVRTWDYHGDHLQELIDLVRGGGIDIMLTISFYPKVSMLAAQARIDYFCWEFDKFANTALLNPRFYSKHTFLFATCQVDTDLLLANHIQACLLPTCRDILLPVDYELTPEDHAEYGCDVSFIGEPLLRRNNPWPDFEAQLADGSEETRAARETMSAVARGALSDQEPYTLRCQYRLPAMVRRRLKRSEFARSLDVTELVSALEKEACRFQRLSFLRLGRHRIDVYGPDEWRLVEGEHLRYRRFAEYDHEAGKIYKASKININLTRIYGGFTGYSNRVFNIVSVGGFLATTPAKNQELFFEPGKECAVYSTPAELQELCDYYLNHEEERAAIAAAGQARFLRDHTIASRVRTMLAFHDRLKS